MTLPWDIPTEAEARWLLDQGLTDTELAPALRVAKVRFLDHRTFDFDACGQRSFVFIVQDTGIEVDIVAWDTARGALATWRGAAFALGQEAIFNPATHFDGGVLHVHRTPLEWLEADRDGIVIVQPTLTYAYLRHASRLSFADAAYARQVQEWLEPPKPTVELLVEMSEETAA